MTFSEYLRDKFGAHWVVAPRLTKRLRAKGYGVALSRSRYEGEQVLWAQSVAKRDPDIAAAVRVLMDHNKRDAAETLARFTYRSCVG